MASVNLFEQSVAANAERIAEMIHWVHRDRPTCRVSQVQGPADHCWTSSLVRYRNQTENGEGELESVDVRSTNGWTRGYHSYKGCGASTLCMVNPRACRLSQCPRRQLAESQLPTQSRVVTHCRVHGGRYAKDSTRAERKLGFRPTVALTTGHGRMLRLFIDNAGWWRTVMDGSHRT